MASAEFEEKQFEIAVAIELAARRGFILSSGQVLENIVGFDVSAHPVRNHAIWTCLNVPRPPGIRLVPAMWPPGRQPAPGDLPISPVSLLLQYKRPEYLYGPRASQWHLWGKPYFRFRRTADQQRVLRRLETRLGAAALVRYMAPAFWKLGELESATITREVIRRSGFVRPSVLQKHQVWTYSQPGLKGRPNPRGPMKPFESFDEMIVSVVDKQLAGPRDVSRTEPRLLDHLRLLGAAARDRQPALRQAIDTWHTRLRHASTTLSPATLQGVVDIASITTLMSQIGGSWHVVLSANRDSQ